MMKRGKLGPDGKKIKPKHGGRKVFFHRLWCRIQGLEIVEEDNALEEKKKKKKLEEEEKAKKRAAAAAKKKKEKAEKEKLAKQARVRDDSYAGRRRQRKKTLKATRTSSRKPKKRTFDDHFTEGSDDGMEMENYYPRKSLRSRRNRKSMKSRKLKSSSTYKKRNSDDSTVTEFTSDESDYDREHSDDDGSESSTGSRNHEIEAASSYGDTSSSNSDVDSLNESEAESESHEESLSGEGEKSDLGEENSMTSEEDDEVWFNGTINLAKQDDPYWLSEVQCYLRNDMIEAFSASEEDVKARGRHIFVGLGNVGLRCVYCAHSPHQKRAKGHIIFPSKLSAIYQGVLDLQRRHFSSCPEMPKSIRDTYKSMRGFTTKEDDETQQYWIDAAKDVGLANSPHGGIIFKRDPLLNSYADTLHEYNNKKNRNEEGNILSISESTNGLIRSRDKQLITDFYLFLFRQVVPCLFREKDKRKGAGLRREYEIGFPGLQCRHCAKKSNNGRYFPFSPKSLADNTTHSLFIHIQGCPNCPEMVKSSLAYLTHRSLLQKNELKRGWKRDLFQRVWDRLHNKDNWTGSKFIIPDDDDNASDNSSTNQTLDESIETDSTTKNRDDDEKINLLAQVLLDLERNHQEEYDSDSCVDSEDLGSDVGDAIQGLYPRRSKRRRNPPQSPVLTRARRSCSLIIRGDNSSRVTRKRRRVNAA